MEIPRRRGGGGGGGGGGEEEEEEEVIHVGKKESMKPIKTEFSGGLTGSKTKTLHERGVDIFWNNTILRQYHFNLINS